jgi:hypothetical protein
MLHQEKLIEIGARLERFLENHLDALARKAGYQVSSLLYFREEISALVCKEFTEVQDIT